MAFADEEIGKFPALGTFGKELPFECRDGVVVEAWRSLIRTNFITTSSVLAKRSCFHNGCIFNVNRRLAEDWELWLEISSFFRMGFVDQVCVIKRVVKEGLSSDRVGMLVSSIEVLEAFLKKKFNIQDLRLISDVEIKTVLFESYKWAGHHGLIIRKGPLARKYLAKALKMKRDLRTIVYYLCSLFLP